MISGRLTMRAQIERNQATGKDAWNAPVAAVMTPIGAPIACFAWSDQSRELVDGQKTALVEDMRAMFAIGADIAEGDEIADITDRAGTVLHVGRWRIEGRVQFKHNHLEAALKAIS